MSTDSLDLMLEQLRAGDHEPLARLFTEYEPYLRKLARQLLTPGLRCELDSVDVVQSAWVHLMQGLPKGNWQFQNRDSLRGFLVRILRNRLIDHARRIQASRLREQHKAVARHEKQMGEPRPSEHAKAGELWTRMLNLCAPQHREILQLKQQGLSVDEIAAAVNLHPGSVRRILYKLARQLATQSGQSSQAMGK